MSLTAFVIPNDQLEQAIARLGQTLDDLSQFSVGYIQLSGPDSEGALLIYQGSDISKVTHILSSFHDHSSQLVSLDLLLQDDSRLEALTWTLTWSEARLDSLAAEAVQPFSGTHFPTIAKLEAAIRSQLPSSHGEIEEVLIGIYRNGWVIPNSDTSSSGHQQPATIDPDAPRLRKSHSPQVKACQPYITRLQQAISIRDGNYR